MGRTVERRKRKLFPHQKQALEYAEGRGSCALFMEMRLGKTLVVIRHISRHLPSDSRILVVAPNSALAAWRRELLLEGEGDVASVRGTRERRLDILAQGHRWNLINKEAHLAVPEIADVVWDAVVCDESTFLKEPRTEVSRFFTENFAVVPYRYVLAGRPNPESTLDFFQQFKFSHGHMMGFRNFWGFWRRMGRPIFYRWVPFGRAAKRIREWIAEESFILRRRDLDVPLEKKLRTIRTAVMPSGIRKVYRAMEEEFMLEYEETQKLTKYSLQQFTWMRRLASGYLEGEEVWRGKRRVLYDLLAGELHGEKVVVWFSFNAELYQVARMLRAEPRRFGRVVVLTGRESPSKRERRYDRWLSGKYRIMLAQAACMQYGGDFALADTAIYYSAPVSGLIRSQTEDRIVKVGKKTPLLYIELMAEDTVDEHIRRMMRQKLSRSDLMLTLCQRLRRRKGR